MDQKDKFIKKGVWAEFVAQAQEDEEAVTAVIKGDIQIVYISPEKLLCNLHFQKCYFQTSTRTIYEHW